MNRRLKLNSAWTFFFYHASRSEITDRQRLIRIYDIEKKIGAGLLEEVIQVAEGELKLVDEMVNSKV